MESLKPVSLVVEVFEELLRNNIMRRGPAETFMKTCIDPTPKPTWLKEALATLIL